MARLTIRSRPIKGGKARLYLEAVDEEGRPDKTQSTMGSPEEAHRFILQTAEELEADGWQRIEGPADNDPGPTVR
jgi:hypothetical protein